MAAIPHQGKTTTEVIQSCDEAVMAQGRAQLKMLIDIAELNRRGVHVGSGASSLSAWLSARYNIRRYVAAKMIAAAKVIEDLPLISEALAGGLLDLDKTLELCRFATPSTEKDLIRWARKVTHTTVRYRADYESRPRTRQMRKTERWRNLVFEDPWQGRVDFHGSLPIAEAVVCRSALERIAAGLPEAPEGDDDDTSYPDARLADALVALCSGTSAHPKVVVHVPAEVLAGKNLGADLEGGGVIHAEIARRLACDSRIELWAEDPHGVPVGLFSETYEVPAALRRAVMRRDSHACTFPGCGSTRYNAIHHVVPWPTGPTIITNLVVLCSLHHKLVHEWGWRVALAPDGLTEWFRPDGSRYDPAPRAGPVPALV